MNPTSGGRGGGGGDGAPRQDPTTAATTASRQARKTGKATGKATWALDSACVAHKTENFAPASQPVRSMWRAKAQAGAQSGVLGSIDSLIGSGAPVGRSPQNIQPAPPNENPGRYPSLTHWTRRLADSTASAGIRRWPKWTARFALCPAGALVGRNRTQSGRPRGASGPKQGVLWRRAAAGSCL